MERNKQKETGTIIYEAFGGVYNVDFQFQGYNFETSSKNILSQLINVKLAFTSSTSLEFMNKG